MRRQNRSRIFAGLLAATAFGAGSLPTAPANAFSASSCIFPSSAAAATRGSVNPGSAEDVYWQGMERFLQIPATPASDAEAVRLLQRAVEAGHGRAAYFLAEMYALGRGTDANLPASRDMYMLSAERTDGAMSKSAACLAVGIENLLRARERMATASR